MLTFYFLYIFKVQVFYPFDSMLSVSIKYKEKNSNMHFLNTFPIYIYSIYRFEYIYIGMYVGNINIFIFIYIYAIFFFLIKRSVICNKPYIHTHITGHIYILSTTHLIGNKKEMVGYVNTLLVH